MTAMPASPLQMVTLVSKGGSPVTIADQFGAPYPTTGSGSIVFNNGPILNNAQFTGQLSIEALLLNPGTAAHPAIAFSSDPTTGIFSPGAGQWAITVSGVQKAVLNSTGATISGDITYSGALHGAYHDPLTNQGDLYYFGPSGSARLPIGAANTVLGSDGTTVSWKPTSSISLISGITPISAGATGRVLYDNAGILSEYPITGTAGNVVMSISPALTGTPTAPTPAALDSSTTLATTAFVHSVLPTTLPPSGTAGGDLSGTYPNPSLGWITRTGAQTLGIGAGGILGSAAFTASTAYLGATAAAGGDLSGNYPNPSLGWITRTGVQTLGIGAGGVLGSAAFTASTAYLGATAAASGDLTGNYPGPTIKSDVALSGAPTIVATVPLANNNQTIATTAFVKGQGYATTTQLGNYLPLAGGVLTGTLTSTLGTITADTPAFNATQTWNNGAVTFEGIKLNVTRTAAADPSYLMRLQVGGTDMFYVDRFGTAVVNGQGFFGGQINVDTGNAPAAGGTQDHGVGMSSTAHFGLFYGSGVPNKAQAQGSWYMRTDATSSNPPFYFNVDGTTTGWQPVSVGTGTWRSLGSVNVVSAQATIDFQNIPSDINHVQFVLGALAPVTNDTGLLLSFYDGTGAINLGATYATSGVLSGSSQAVGAAPVTYASTGVTFIHLQYNAAGNQVAAGAANGGWSGIGTIPNIKQTAGRKNMVYHGNYQLGSGAQQANVSGMGTWTATGANQFITGLRFYFSSGNIASGIVELFGSP